MKNYTTTTNRTNEDKEANLTTWEEYKDYVAQDEEGKRYLERAEEEYRLIDKIKTLRERKGLSQKELADLCGLKQSAIARMENMGSVPNLSTVIDICGAMDFELDILPKNSFMALESTEYYLEKQKYNPYSQNTYGAWKDSKVSFINLTRRCKA